MIVHAESKWDAYFYPNDSLKGNPIHKTFDSIDFDWGWGSPDPSIPGDYFSALFTTDVQLDEGVYNFRVWANDGVQVFVNDRLVINEWDNDQGLRFFGKPIYLKSGKYTIKIKYKELVGVAQLKFEIDDLLRDNRWYGMAFSNPNLIGDTALLGYQPQIPELNFDWGWGSPAPNIPSDNFSTVFQRKYYLEEGIYNLRVWANDGVQVYVNGELVIDEWDNNQGLRFFGKPIYLKSGTHKIMIKHKELVGVAQLRFEIDDLLRDNRWYGMAFSNPDFTGRTALLGYQPQIPELNFDWGWGSPASNIPSDNFSTIFQRKIHLDEGIYNLRVWANDGVQVYVNGDLVIDEWDNNQGLRFFGKPIYLKSGTHKIMIKHKELVGVAQLRFEIDDLLRDNRWYGMAFSNPDFTGETALLGYQPQIPDLDFNWGQGSPAENIPSDNFSTIFQRKLQVKEGVYTLKIRANDGVQVYVDGELLIDQWNNRGSNTFESQTYLSSGIHNILIKHKDIDGDSEIKFDIEEFESKDKWYGVAYSNPDLTGKKVVLQGNELENLGLHFNWGWNSPAPDIPKDNFSTLFYRDIEFEEGVYNLRVWANDGVQVFVDGELVIDEWDNNQGLRFFGKPIYLKSGTHRILIKHKELVGVSELRFEIDDLLRDNRWYGMAFSNPDFTGKTALLGYQPQIPELNFDWGWGSPASNIPSDNFSTIFQRKIHLDEGIYNLRVWANDGVQVYVNGELVIDEWDNNQGLRFFGKPIYLKSGTHKIMIKHKELVGVAQLRFEIDDLLRDNRWYGMAFSNPDFTGDTALLGYQPQIPELNLDWGWGSPASNIPSDNFSTIFQKKIHVKEGAYNLRVWANDGVQVYVNGELVIDEWDNNQGLRFFGKPIYLKSGTHKILIKHKELVGVAQLQFEIDDLMRDNRWYGLAFPNKNFTGTPVLLGYQPQIPDLNFDWGTGSPHESIPNDNFSVLFQRYIVTGNGEYQLNVEANDGVRVYIDDKLVIDGWNNKSYGKWSKTIKLSAGRHRILVKNFEETGVAMLKVSVEPKQSEKVIYVNYNLTLNQMADIQMKAGPLTDKKYKLWVREDAFEYIRNGKGKIKNSNWNLRRGPGTEYRSERLVNGQEFTIKGSAKGSDGYTWYYVDDTKGWVVPDRADLVYYLNPNNFMKDFRGKLQFLKLSEPASINPQEVNAKILNNNAGILKNRAGTFVKAAEKYRVNEIYLIAHALLETGNGKSALSNGSIKVGRLGDNKWVSIQKNGAYTAELVNNKWVVKSATNSEVSQATNVRSVYNMYGIGAFDSNPETLGSVYAYRNSWFTPDDAIIGGAKFIGEGYVDRGQDTLYKMRWNPDFAEKHGYASHQYASDIGWAYKQTYKMNQLYSMLNSYSLVFEIPVYK